MLLFTRRVGERFMVGPDVTVVVRKVQGGCVQIGVSAPDDVEIDREEVRLRKLQERRNG